MITQFINSGKEIDIILEKLKNDICILGRWFENNSLVANASKFQLMFLGNIDNENIELDIFNTKIKNQTEVELLGITIDNKLNFASHIAKVYKKANNKLNAIIRLRDH